MIAKVTKGLVRSVSMAGLLALLPTAPAIAQTEGAAAAMLEEIIVTARKRANAEAAQDTSISISAFGEEQLEALHVRDLSSLSFGLPNVSLDDVGTAKGVANFSIRGLGINSSIPSIEPTVGVFVDGMYLGVNAGVVFDLFDLEGVEVLRGPQGTLYGRNVTGGAVLIRSKRPNLEEVEASAKLSVETGLNKTVGATLSGPLGDSGLAAKIAVYHNDDDGYFENLFNGDDNFGRSKMTVIRPSLAWEPADGVDIVLRYEHGNQEGDGPPGQNHGLHSRDSFDFSINLPGYNDLKWNHAIAEGNWRVGFGDGVITNILGWREMAQRNLVDIDSSPQTLFHASLDTDQDQISNELRYAGSFGNVEVTTGLYYFQQDLAYQENRALLNGARYLYGGGVQDSSAYGLFGSADIGLSDAVTLTTGLRYSYEKKNIRIGTLRPGPATPSIDQLPAGACNVKGACAFDFQDKQSWDNITPKLGLEWKADDDVLLYGFWTKGFRSGGYKMRNTSPTAAPGPFDEESQNSYEVGMKSDLLDNHVRFNTALFYNDVSDMQREVNLADPTAGVVQIIRNTADATIWGVEADLQALVADGFLLSATLGYTNGEYDKIKFDLTGDNQVNAADLALKLPRLAPWTYGAGFTFDRDVEGIGMFTLRATWSHRDKSFYTDNNRGRLNEAEMVDASLSLTTWDDQLTLSLYGKNLLDEVTFGGDTQLPFFAGATFSPLSKGRIVGVEATLDF